MGCQESKSQPQTNLSILPVPSIPLPPEIVDRSKDIDKELEAAAKIENSRLRMLLLGAGESGKSTIFKQMKIIYGEKYSVAERRYFIGQIFLNVLETMKTLCTKAFEFGMANDIKVPEELALIIGLPLSSNIDIPVGNAIKLLWLDPTIRAVWDRRSEFHAIDSFQYYFNKIDIIKLPGYLPDNVDILHCRIRTSGVMKSRYTIDAQDFEIIDVGGQRNERKKWIHCFEGVTAVIFVVAISEYDQMMFEDTSVNRMEDALKLFEFVCNNVYFQKSSMILFLNKVDLFSDKIEQRPLRNYFSDYTGRDKDCRAGCDYFMKKFKDLNVNSSKPIYAHLTCATDTNQIGKVLDACKNTIIKENLKKTGFID